MNDKVYMVNGAAITAGIVTGRTTMNRDSAFLINLAITVTGHGVSCVGVAHLVHNDCIHELFKEHAERTPNGIAVVYEDCQLTYRELDRRANQLAHYLRTQGVTQQVLVAICHDRCIEIPIAILAVLKSGGAYAPLDRDTLKRGSLS